MGLIIDNVYTAWAASKVFSMELVPPDMLAKWLVTAFFVVINLSVTYIVIKLFLFKPVMKFLDQRKQHLQEEMSKVKSIRQAADEKLSKASERSEDAIREATGIINDARLQARAQSEKILSDAKREAEQIISQAQKDNQRTRTMMTEEMRQEAADLSVAIASKIIQRELEPEGTKQLIEKLIDEEISGKGSRNDAAR